MEQVKQPESKVLKILKRIWDGPVEEGDFAPGLDAEKVFGESVFGEKKEAVEEKRQERRDPEPPRRFEPEPVRPTPAPIRQNPFADGTPSSDEMTVISKGAVLTGDLICDGNLDMLGAITGNISSKGTVRLTGRIEGNVQAANITMVGCAVQGNIAVTGSITMDGESVLIGDMEADAITTDGRIKGNLSAKSAISCQGGAYLLGDVTAGSINVSSGARIQGKMEISDGHQVDIQLPQR